MDVDLSTDLRALLPLVAGLVSGHSDVAIGTRLAPGLTGAPRPQARVHLALLQPDPAARPRRALLRRPVRVQGDPRRRGRARCCPRWSTRAGSSTPSCWSWPSAAGLRIHEVPVDWIEDPDSRVDIVAHRARRPTRRARLRLVTPVHAFPARRRRLDAVVYALLYLLLRGALGQRRLANALALATDRASANTQTNRHFTFGLAAARGWSPACRGRARLPPRARAHRRRPRPPARARPPPLAPAGGDRPRRGQRVRDRHPLRGAPGLGVRPPVAPACARPADRRPLPLPIPDRSTHVNHHLPCLSAPGCRPPPRAPGRLRSQSAAATEDPAWVRPALFAIVALARCCASGT